jgi:hypothetical protein
MMPAGAPRLQPSGPDDVAPPRLLGTLVSASNLRSVEAEAQSSTDTTGGAEATAEVHSERSAARSQSRFVNREDLPALLCESASASFWAWLPCSQTSNTVCSPPPTGHGHGTCRLPHGPPTRHMTPPTASHTRRPPDDASNMAPPTASHTRRPPDDASNMAPPTASHIRRPPIAHQLPTRCPPIAHPTVSPASRHPLCS